MKKYMGQAIRFRPQDWSLLLGSLTSTAALLDDCDKHEFTHYSVQTSAWFQLCRRNRFQARHLCFEPRTSLTSRELSNLIGCTATDINRSARELSLDSVLLE
jgi:hypothetical protein